LSAVLSALVVDDDKNSRRALAELVADAGFAVHQAGSLKEARGRLRADLPDVVLLDLILPDGTGFDLLADLDPQAKRAEVVVITGHASVSTAVEALRRGATDYLTKPVDTARLELMLANLARTRALRPKVADLRSQVRQRGGFGPLVGASPAMERVYDLVSRVAPSSATVLITGESGTGKELVAATVHALSRRAARPYLVVNCAAISPTLIDSELFGHERGSFTGAERVHHGYFERADGGTLFLDEVSEMPAELQAKLLRVLESGAVARVGAEKLLKIDVRIIAASNRDLEAAAEEGKFRQDLLYRLNLFPIRLPPLRERAEDIEALAEHFLAELNLQEGARKTLASATVAILRRCPWPGNVRELKNVIHQAFLLTDGTEIGPASLAPELTGRARAAKGRLEVGPGTPLAQAERWLILASLDHYGGDRRKTAAALGVSLRTLYNRLRQYGSE
jgi:DNA-binding NtrC family response regulator